MTPENDDITRTHLVLAPGTEVHHYRIVDKIGAGGMGEVFLAEDTRLETRIALKFLPGNMADDGELRSRFVREAKALARQNHPNVVSVYEVGEHEGRPFIVMEHVTGEMLRHYCEAERQPISTILEWSVQLCQGLGEAHRNGIVHRDIKTTNVIVDTTGRIRILDFGLAAMTDNKELTKTGSTLGTVAYMSPEQISGREIDRRSDLFSLGVMLYELMTGVSPFKRNSEGATLQAIMQDEPRPLSQFDDELSAGFHDIVFKLLHKDRELRYQSAEGVLADLKRLLYDSRSTSSQSVSGGSADNSIVVLPFENLSSEKDNEYFSDGLTDEIMTDLSGLGNLRVISKTSSMKLKSTDLDARAIGQQLHVRYILMGSVRKAGNNVRITAQLVDSTNNNLIWADKYKGTLEDIFEIQEQVSRFIVSTLKIKLTAEEKQDLEARPIENPEAFEFYLRAKQELQTWDVEGLRKAEQYLRRGLEIVGDNALLYATLAHTLYQYVNIGHGDERLLPQIEAALEKALKLNPRQPDAYFVKSLIAQTFGSDRYESIKMLKRVLELRPNSVEAKRWLAMEYALCGQTARALRILDEARVEDPLNISNLRGLAFTCLMEGRDEDLLRLTWDIFHSDPDAIFNICRLVHVLTYLDDTDKARSYVHLIDGESFFERLALACYYGRIGEKERALGCVNDDLIATARRDSQYSLFVSWIYSAVGEVDSAVDWLESAFDRGFLNHEFLSRHDRYSRVLRDAPRFKSLIDRMRTAQEAFDA